MTLLIAWAAIDTHGVSSVYMASDSRISWSNSIQYDYAKKIFNFKNSPDIVGYCGDVLFPSIVLNQLVELADQGLLFEENMEPKEKFERICNRIKFAFSNYPHEKVNVFNGSLEIVYLSRNVQDNKKFYIYSFELVKGQWHGFGGSISDEEIYRKGNKIIFPEKNKENGLPKYSTCLITCGSGKKSFGENYSKRYQYSKNRKTSRNIFHCFCDTLLTTEIFSCGGAPQVSGIYRKPESAAFNLGIILNDKRYFLGTRIDDAINYENIEWRNTFFEIVDPNKKTKKVEAQSQPDLLKRY